MTAFLAVVGALLWGLGEAVLYRSSSSDWDLAFTFNFAQGGVGILAVTLVLLLRIPYVWPEGTPNGVARATCIVAFVVACLVVVAAGIHAAQPFADDINVWTRTDKAGVLVESAGNALVAIGLALISIRGFSVLHGRAPVEPSGVRTP